MISINDAAGSNLLLPLPALGAGEREPTEYIAPLINLTGMRCKGALFGTLELFRRSPQREKQRSCSNPLRAQGRFFIVAFCIGVAAAPGDQTTAPVLKGSAAFGGFDQDRPGLRRLIQPQDLPPLTRSTTASAQGATRRTASFPRFPRDSGCPGRIRSHRSARNQSGAERRRLHRRKQGE